MQTLLETETKNFWLAVKSARRVMREPDAAPLVLEDCMSEIEAISLYSDSPALKTHCRAVLAEIGQKYGLQAANS